MASVSGAPALLLRVGVLRSAAEARVTAVLLDEASRVTLRREMLAVPVSSDRAAEVDAIVRRLAAFVRTSAGSLYQDLRLRAFGFDEKTLELVRSAVADRERADSLARAGATAAALANLRIADSLLARAEAEAPEWNEPTLQRAETSLGRMWAHLQAGAMPDAHAVLDAGLGHAARALGRAPDDVAALEIDAVLRHWIWRTAGSDLALLHVPRALERDLRGVVERDPTRARAWNLLSALLLSRGAFGEALWAAERAHAADTYLEHASDNLARLFVTSLEAADTAAARHWCDELGQRHPRQAIVAYCQLMQVAWSPVTVADVVRGWEAIDALQPNARESPPWPPRLQSLMGVILAKGNLADSARSVLRRAKNAGPADPELLPLLAWGALALNDRDSAASLLHAYIAPRRTARGGVLASSRFAPIRNYERLQALLLPPSERTYARAATGE
jgi:hypothetical protein